MADERKVALVTGSALNIGRAIALALAEDGFHIMTTARQSENDARETARLVREAGSDADTFMADISDHAQAKALVDATVARFGRLDVLVNNAGGAPYAMAADASPRFHAKVAELNLLAPLILSQAANAVMQEQEYGGVIVNVSSVSALRPSPGTAAYGAAKAGLDSLTRTLAVEWAPRVRVVGMDVGLVLTEQSDLHYGGPSGVARVAATVPLGRLATPRDIGNVAVFLASPLASYVSGASLEVHGGGEAPAFLAAAQSPTDD
jgi:NAD(P)-dependent dehydrogenase (short-subunit alcohol dehydrogenase family)